MTYNQFLDVMKRKVDEAQNSKASHVEIKTDELNRLIWLAQSISGSVYLLYLFNQNQATGPAIVSAYSTFEQAKAAFGPEDAMHREAILRVNLVGTLGTEIPIKEPLRGSPLEHKESKEKTQTK